MKFMLTREYANLLSLFKIFKYLVDIFREHSLNYSFHTYLKWNKK